MALAAFLTSTALVMTGALLWPGAEVFQLIASVFLGPLALTFAVLVLWFRSGGISAPAALITAVLTIPALALAALALASWSAGFAVADAGGVFTWFEALSLPLGGAAWIAGTAALIPPVSCLLRLRSDYARTAKIVLLAAVAALALGLLYVTVLPAGPLAAAAVLFLALRSGQDKEGQDRESQARESHGPDAHRTEGAVRGSNSQDLLHPVAARPEPVPVSRAVRTSVAGIAAATLLIGLLSAWFALFGSGTSLAGNSTEAMNLGLAAGALNAIPVVLALGMVLVPRFGRVLTGSAVLASAGLATESAAQLAGAGHPVQWPLTVAAGLLLGVALVLPFARLIPGSTAVRVCATAAAGLAAAFVGLNVVAAAGFIAPIVAGALLVWCFARPSQSPAVLQGA
ncbi:hypothetical protein AO716_10100 [Arthrobacter sp. Edens01]|nr:hypothetical protein AO716_10100 [Arthrobacter sp. Edens01]